jgi:hypothetical protein
MNRRKNKRRAGHETSAALMRKSGRLSASRDFQLGADMHRNFGRIVVNKVPDAVMGDTPKLRPRPESADRGFFAGRKYPTLAQTDNIRELASKKGRDWCFHASSFPSTHLIHLYIVPRALRERSMWSGEYRA